MSKPRTVWIDGVGGYAIYDQSEIIFGGRGCGSDAVEIVSELPKRAFSIRYVGDEYVVQSSFTATLEVNSASISGACILSSGDRIKVGDSVTLLFSKPSPLSDTATVTITSRHRWPESIDGLILIRGLCILGPNANAHVNCRSWSQTMTLFRQQELWQYRLQSKDTVHRSGLPSRSIVIGERILGEDFSLTII